MSWKKLSDFEVTGKRIIIKDGMIMLSENEKKPEWPCVTVSPGQYLIEYQKEDGIYTSARIYQQGTTPELGKLIGNLDIDSAKAGFCDYELLLAEVNKNFEDYSNWTDNECEEAVFEKEKGSIKFKKHKMVFLQAGDGDGSYPVFELKEKNKVVGMQCDFKESE